VGHFLFGLLGLRLGGPLINSLLAAVFGGFLVIVIGRFLSK
jgi:uncharacterized membrane protein YeaQ/YmgE (transglycosylase-associated protein family)